MMLGSEWISQGAQQPSGAELGVCKERWAQLGANIVTHPHTRHILLPAEGCTRGTGEGLMCRQGIEAGVWLLVLGAPDGRDALLV